MTPIAGNEYASLEWLRALTRWTKNEGNLVFNWLLS